MKITRQSQFKLGTKYYYANTKSPNLIGQEDCVCVLEVTYENISEEYKKRYGFDPDSNEVLKSTGVVYCEGRNPVRQDTSYMGTDWIRSINFYTTIDEACCDAVKFAFEDYRPFETK